MAKKVTKKKTSTKKKATTRKRTTAQKPAKAVAAAPVTPTATPTVMDDQIRIRAFEIYCAGQNPSNPDADWHQAEQELRT